MADFHNISDLRAIRLLESMLRDVQFELRQCEGYDPAESLAENAKMFIQCSRLLGDLYRNLKKQYEDLKKEHENDKEVARGYPLAEPCGIYTVADVPTAKTFPWYKTSGRLSVQSDPGGPCE